MSKTLSYELVQRKGSDYTVEDIRCLLEQYLLEVIAIQGSEPLVALP